MERLKCRSGAILAHAPRLRKFAVPIFTRIVDAVTSRICPCKSRAGKNNALEQFRSGNAEREERAHSESPRKRGEVILYGIA
jgi:hypothetical protein